MSFALQPSQGSARLLGPQHRAGGGGGKLEADCSEKVQGAIQAVQRFAADIRKEAGILSTARSRGTSAQHVQQVASVAKDTVNEAKRWLGEMDAGSQNVATDEKKLLRLKCQKLSENLSRATSELDASWAAFRTADAAWASRQAAAEAAAGPAGPGADLEAGGEAAQGGLQLQEAELVTQAEADLHAAIADEYAQGVQDLARSVKGLQRCMVDLAEHAQAQGEVLDNIEANMGAASDKASAALEQIQITDQSQRNGLKRTACLFMVVTLVSAATVAAVWR